MQIQSARTAGAGSGGQNRKDKFLKIPEHIEQVPKIPLLEHLAVLVAAQLELVKTAALHLKEVHQAPFVRGWVRR